MWSSLVDVHLSTRKGLLTDCRYFAGLYHVLRIVLLLATYGGSVFGMYDEMVSIVCLVIAALVFLLFRPYKDNFWLNIWDSTVFSLLALVLFGNMYARYIAPVPFQILGVLSSPLLIYFILYVAYKLLIWTKALPVCMKHRDHPTLQSQEPDRLLHPEEYNSEEHKPLLAGGEGNNSENSHQDIETETYPQCGNSQQPSYTAIQSSLP